MVLCILIGILFYANLGFHSLMKSSSPIVLASLDQVQILLGITVIVFEFKTKIVYSSDFTNKK